MSPKKHPKDVVSPIIPKAHASKHSAPKHAEVKPTSPKTDIVSFEDFNFSPELMKSIKEAGFETPTPIQAETIPLLLAGQTDFLGLAATGTGKTAAYALPLLEGLDGHAKGVQALILCPTRELAKQVSEQINLLARYKKTKSLAIYGGSDYGGQLRALKEGVSIVVGTPGRIIDHLERGTLNLDNLKTVILDEADEMISMGFKEEIEFILEKVNQEEKHQTWLFSATMSREIRKIADQFLDSPKQIQINKTEVLSNSVKQYFYMVREDEKPDVIGKLIDQVPGFYGLIFCQTKALVTELTQILKSQGYAADCLHGDMEQNARERTMKAFKAKLVNIMVCTDVASRGIDVKDLTHVINYSLPRELDLYIHRIGRTGRGGKEGIALSLVTPSHNGLIYRIEKATQSRMIKANLPTDAELITIKVQKALADFLAPAAEGAMGIGLVQEQIAKTEWKRAVEQMSKEEIIARFLAKTLKVKKKSTQALIDHSELRRGGGGGGRDRDRGSRSYSDRGPRSYSDRAASTERRPGDHAPRARPSGAFKAKAGSGEKSSSPHFKGKPFRSPDA